MPDECGEWVGFAPGSVYDPTEKPATVEPIRATARRMTLLEFEDMMERISPERPDDSWFCPDRLCWVTRLSRSIW